MTTIEAFDHIAENLASIDPNKIIALKAPDAMADRVEELIQLKKDEVISTDQIIELERYLSLDLLINLAKARAKYLIYQA